MSDSRLRWQCRRGMRELDELLLRYLDSRYAEAPPGEKSAFGALLELSDPELVAYLLKNEPPESQALAEVVQQILCIDPR